MKRNLLLLAIAATPMLLSACAQEPPPPVVINRYETRRVIYRERPRSTVGPINESRGNGSAEGFRAVEKPSSYSGQ